MANKKTAILIGNTEFPMSKKALCPLPSSEEDINKLEAILTDPNLGESESLRLIDLPHYQISTAANKVFREACRDDQIIFYYSGHAKMEIDQQLHLTTIDTDITSLLTTSIRAENLANMLRGTQCRRIIFILDLYYASPISQTDLVSSIKSCFENFKSSITEGYSLSLIAAYQKINGSSTKNHLVKTIVDGIENGDADENNDGSITTDELTGYITEAFLIKNEIPPICVHYGSQNSFIFSKSKERFISKPIITKIKKKLKELPNNHEINQSIVLNAIAILDKNHTDIEKYHQSGFKLLKEWCENKTSDKDFLNQWFQYEGTDLPETETPRQSTALRDRWNIIKKYRGSMQDLIGPTYILDSNFQFLDWNPMFDELIAKPLGLMRGVHVESFILELENKSQVIKRSNRIYKQNIYPIVDIEPLFLSTKYGVVEFKKIASKIPNDINIDLWSVNLNIVSAENSALMWRDLRKRIKKDVNWSLYAKAYDQVLLNFDSYKTLVTDVVEKLGDAKNVVDLASGTGNNTIELLTKDPSRTVWALEYNQEMLEYMWDKVAELNFNAINNINIVKGDLILSLREFDDNFFDGAVMMNALYAMDDRAHCLREIYRVLKPGAILVYSSSTKDTDVEHLFSKIRENLKEKGKLDDDMDEIVSGAYDRHLDMLASILHDSHEDLINYATAAGFIVDPNDIVKDAYEGAVTIIKAQKRDSIICIDTPDNPIPKTLKPEIKTTTPKVTHVFISYSHRDKKWCKKLRKYIKPITNDGTIEVWSDQDLEYGDRWRDIIQKKLAQSSIAILLISPDFLNSEFIANSELPTLLHSSHSEGLLIIPLILETCLYDILEYNYPDSKMGPHKFKLSEFQSAGSLTKTLDTLEKPEQNRIFDEIARKIKSLSEQNF